MLFTSVRVRPCSARWRGWSLGRTTRISPSARSMLISGWISRSSVPSGPLTRSREPSCVSSTPDGSEIGSRPMRDISVSSPHVAQHLAAEIQLPGLRPGHDPVGGGENGQAQAAENARDLGLAGIHPQAGLADAL